jgi:ABC-type nitrate/sulfonate/bicarbonate transport system substrate-binding protein
MAVTAGYENRHRSQGMPCWRVLAALALLSGMASACTAMPAGDAPPAGRPADTAAAPAPRAPTAAPPRLVKISVPGASLSYLPAKVAAELGFYRDEGLEVEFVQLGGELAVAAVLSGQADFTTITSAAMAAIAKGAPLKTVHYQSVRLVHALLGRPEVATVAELSGKRIGVQRLGDLTAFQANWVIERYGLRDVVVLQTGPERERLAALASGNIDATFLARPWDLVAEREGMRRLLNMWEALEMAQVGLVCTIATLTEQEAMVRGLMRANNRAAAAVRDPARRDEVAQVVANCMDIPLADAQRIVAELRDTYTPTGLASEEAISAFLEVLKQSDAVPSTATVAEMVDFTLARQVAREMGLLP